MKDDTDLIEAARHGSDDAMVQLYALNYTHAKKQAGKLLRSTRHGEEIEDCVQESFMRAFRNISSFAGTCTFRTWLTTIVINTCRELIRKQRAGNRDVRRTVPLEPYHAKYRTCKHQEGADAWHDLAKILPLLDERTRCVLELKYLHGWRYAALAQHFNSTVPAMKSVVVRGLQRARSAASLDA